MRRPIALCLFTLALASLCACQSFPPALTGVTIAACSADGVPQNDSMCRTRQGAPIPLIALRPGADPNWNGPLLNEPNGDVAVTLARGVQSFLLLTAMDAASPYYVISLFLDHESTPALTGLVTGDRARPVTVSPASVVMGLRGEPVSNRSADSAVRGGYRVSLRRAAFPLDVTWLDLVGPWRYVPDHVSDAVGLITIEVEPLTHEDAG